ncbi:MAG: phospho-N-acetylmuramoyl-pentapeptide-transferase [Bacteroidales bacterium]|nr:phospho-N-acetylmuramoyl-pentapeptide-transferase [Candidatus Sodaliphilus aphodohippi]
MLYHLFHYLTQYDVPGARLFDYITFRSGFALVLSLFIAIVIGGRIINWLKGRQMCDKERSEGEGGSSSKQGTPTMGGVIIIISILIPCLLIGKLNSVYMLLMIVSTIWCGALGFADDYIKVFHHHKEGLKGKFKIVGQVGLGLIVACTMYMSPAIVINENVEMNNSQTNEMVVVHKSKAEKSPVTTIPFIKNHNLNYSYFTRWMGDYAELGGWLLFALLTIFVVTAVSNGANLTDGMDGLAAGTSAIAGIALAIMCYLGGNVIYASYLNIMYIPGSSELVVYAAAFIGATIGFLWYNSYPAQVFMGDTGSLCLGGIIGVFALLIRKEWLLVILCGVFLVETLSVMLQVSYNKYHLRRYGVGKRLFRMTPLHHHFAASERGITWEYVIHQKPIHEAKVVTRFFLIAIFLAVITFVTLKIR